MKIVGYVKGRKPSSLYTDNLKEPTLFKSQESLYKSREETVSLKKMDRTPIISIKFKILTKWYGKIASGYSMTIQDIETKAQFEIVNNNIIKTILQVQEGHFKMNEDYFVGFFKPVVRNRVVYLEPQTLDDLQKMDREF